jgi:hypothetical protein
MTQNVLFRCFVSLFRCFVSPFRCFVSPFRGLVLSLDLNSDGHISREEFKWYFQTLAPDLSEADVTHSFDVIDSDKNGEISREEFFAAAFDFYYGVEETEISKVFFGPLMS